MVDSIFVSEANDQIGVERLIQRVFDAENTVDIVEKLDMEEEINFFSNKFAKNCPCHIRVIVDSGATCHMSPYPEMINHLKPITNRRIMIIVGDRRQISASGIDQSYLSEIGSILYVPELSVALFSVAKLQESGHGIDFPPNGGCSICQMNNNKRETLFNIRNGINGLFQLNRYDIYRLTNGNLCPSHQKTNPLELENEQWGSNFAN